MRKKEETGEREKDRGGRTVSLMLPPVLKVSVAFPGVVTLMDVGDLG
jgi:hypothetical protein